MKPLLCCLFLVLSFWACHQRPAPSDIFISTGLPDSVADKGTGTYSGFFGKGLITVVINYISGRTVSGYDIHKGLRRNFNGEVTQQGRLLHFVLKEPGDNRYDGTFSIDLDSDSGKITGRWVPIDSAKARTRQLTLTRKNEDESMYGDEWLANGSYDSLLIFRRNGVCTFEFYNGPGDSTSQLTTIKGNYELDEKEKIYRIEWEKNNYLNPPSMKLNIEPEKEGNDSVEFMPRTLRGNGWRFVKNMAG